MCVCKAYAQESRHRVHGHGWESVCVQLTVMGREGDMQAVVFQALRCYQGVSELALVVGMFWALQKAFINSSRRCDKK